MPNFGILQPQPDAQLGGILGSGAGVPALQPWQGRLGLFGAGLKDIGAQLASRPEDANNVQNYGLQLRQEQDREAARRAVMAMNSDDPGERKSGYTAYAMLGGDPTPFMKLKADAAMPDLLAAMQPKQTIADGPVGVTPAVTAQGPEADAQRAAASATNAAPVTTMAPGMGLLDAIKATKSPELASTMAPTILNNQMEVAMKGWRPATAAEKIRGGYNVGDPVFINGMGEYNSAVKPQAEITQQEGVADHVTPLQRRELDIKEQEANKPIPGGYSGTFLVRGKNGNWETKTIGADNGPDATANLQGDDLLAAIPDGARTMVKAIATGRMAGYKGRTLNMPIYPGGPTGGEMMKWVNQYAGPDGYDETSMPTRTKARGAFASGQDGKTVTAFNAVADHLATAKPLFDALKTGNVQAFNAAAQAWGKATGNAAPQTAQMAGVLLGDELAKAVIGNGGTKEDREAMQGFFANAKSPQAMQSAFQNAMEFAAGKLRAEKQKYKSQVRLPDFNDQLTPNASWILQNNPAPSLADAMGGNGGKSGTTKTGVKFQILGQ